ncbi:thioredoxin family protein [Polaribacter sp. MSW13]|uniref:Thioredoxin family protein n=1 Tax=Polaribacter marinus TaxID=2916838 RepID=A0A9X2AIS2_9FLAO|nr:thioredoxin family protein [Polaribacter marinus]MCI2228806.1 thioredoxin family protein [Polaribacter marinus]
MKKLVLIAILGVLTSCNAQQKVTATKNKSGDLVGIANKESFSDDAYKGWFNRNYESYKTDQATINSLKKALKGYKIKGFMGTWCGDSKRETPRFFKVLEEAGFDLKNVELVTVNRSKKTPDNLQEGLDIKRVPTFIFYKKGKEVGRYVEYARESIEKDILKIVSGKTYKHSYDK